MIYYAKTDKGKIRHQNEDFLYAPEGRDGFFAVVADGMGGHRAGEVASKSVVETVKDALKPIEKISEDDIRCALLRANKNVLKASEQDAALKGMGSTATVAVFQGQKALIGHVGDSRAYLYRAGVLSQITKDHSYVQMLIDNGYISAADAKNHPNRNVITRAVGTDEELDIDTFSVPLEKGDTILLCSDGLNTVLSDNEIAETLSKGVDKAADALIDAALKNGGIDNISVVLAFMDGESV